MFERSNYTENEGKFDELRPPGGLWSQFIRLFWSRGVNLVSSKNVGPAERAVLEALSQDDHRSLAIQKILAQQFGRIEIHSFYALMHQLEVQQKVELVYRSACINGQLRSAAFYRLTVPGV